MPTRRFEFFVCSGGEIGLRWRSQAMAIGTTQQIFEEIKALGLGMDRILAQLGEIERRMLAAEGHLSSFFISQNRQSAELERINRRLTEIEARLAIAQPPSA
ncbi:MAG: hypothetical protein R3D57_13175 [Hyphomicrobiaceae bacterium]